MLAPRNVCIVLSPSGVTITIHLAVGRPSVDFLQRNLVPTFSILLTNSLPKSSSLTLPQKNAFPPKCDMAARELATDPPASFLTKLISFKRLSDSF